MSNLSQNTELKSDMGELSVKQLMELYEGTVDELRFCANFVPKLNVQVEDVDLREFALLNLESNIVAQAASVRLLTEGDILTLMDVWVKVAGIEEQVSPSPSDQIVMNIFRHVGEGRLIRD